MSTTSRGMSFGRWWHRDHWWNRPLSSHDPFKLGLVTLAGILVLALLVVGLSQASFGKTTYTAMFAQSANLRPNEDVQVAGVRVGEVRSVRLDGDRVAVRFTVDDDIHLGRGTTAAIKVATLLGTHLLQVVPHGSGDLAHHTIPLARTTVPFNLQDVLGKGTTQLARFDGNKLAEMLTVLSRQLSPSTPQLGPALRGVIRFSDVVTRHSDQLGDLLTAARRVTRQLSDSSADLVALMKRTNLVVEEITTRRHAIHLLLTKATTLSKNLRGVIADTRADTGPALRALNAALATLRAQDSTLRHVLDTMAPAVRYVANATGNGPYIDLWNKPPLLPANDSRICAVPGVCP